MNVLHVIPYFNPKRGGDVNVCCMVAKELANKGNNVTIITTDYEFDKEYASSIKKVNIIPFRCFVNLSLFLISPSMINWLKKNLADFDVIHLHDFRTFQNILIWHYAKKYNIPYIIQAHGDLPYAGIKNRRKRAFDEMFGYPILNNASGLIALTATELEEYINMGAKKENIVIIPNGVDLSGFEILPKKGEFRKKFSISQNYKIILYIGRIHKTKGLDLLLHAFRYLLNEQDNKSQIILLVVGPDYGELESLKKLAKDLDIADNVVFTGFVSQREKTEAFVDADIFVTPTFLGFPVSFLEACICGKPIITTTNGDNLDWINNSVGYVVDFDEHHLAAGMLNILNDRNLTKRFGEEGKRLAKEKFNWVKIVNNIEDFYKRCNIKYSCR